jgi:hypothetical protein
VLECYGGTYASHLDGGAIKEWLAYFSAYGSEPGTGFAHVPGGGERARVGTAREIFAPAMV